jgi:TRAP-type transport system periplasmic protein
MRPIILSFALVMLFGMLMAGCASSTQTSVPAPASSTTTTAASKPAPPQTPIATTSSTAASVSTPTGAPPAPIVLKSATFIARNAFTASGMMIIAKQVNERSKGQLTIQYLGGPEIIPSAQLPEAIRKNIIQLAVCPASFYDGLVPIGTMMEISELNPEEEDTSGAFAYISEIHQKADLIYLGRATAIRGGGYHTLLVNKPMTRPQQLAGMRIGASGVYLVPFLKAVGAAPVLTPPGDIYSSLERGMLDGFGNPLTNFRDLQIFEVTKYVIANSYYQASGAFIFSSEAWKQLSKENQNILIESARAAIQIYMDGYAKEQADSLQKAADKGLKTINFSDADRDWFYKMLYDSAWDDNAKRYPEQVAKLRPMETKKK